MGEKLAGVNPRILKWARERARYSLEYVAGKLKKTVSTIEKWESGEDAPTYAQLEKLAYQIYKRPLALFFFPEPPIEAEENEEFRTLPEFEIENLAPDTVFALREAKAMQLSLKEINDNANPSENKIFRDILIQVTDDLEKVTETVRNYLNISLSEQISWKDDNFAFKSWRNKIEEKGIFIFKRSFEQKEISGFCLIDAEFPIIYINNGTTKSRQIFTIFHELAHILLNTSGITKSDDSYIKSLRGEKQNIEVFCNRFAAEFLIPSYDFNEESVAQNIDDAFIFNTASKYKVSREVVLRKLLDKGSITSDEYNRKVQIWKQEYESRDKVKQRGGNPYATQATYLGENYLKLVFNKYYQGKYDIERVADYLNLKKVESAENLEKYLLEKDVL